MDLMAERSMMPEPQLRPSPLPSVHPRRARRVSLAFAAAAALGSSGAASATTLTSTPASALPELQGAQATATAAPGLEALDPQGTAPEPVSREGLRAEEPAPAPATTATIAGAGSKPAAAPTGVSLSGYAQVDYQRLELSSDQLADGTGTPLNEDRVIIRRARARLSGDWTYLGFVAEANFSTSQGPELGARHVEVMAMLPGDAPGDPPLVRLGAGLFEVPFGFEVFGQGNKDRLFTERSLMAQAFVPGEFDVGARLSGGYRWARWAVAVQNGEPIGARAFPAQDPNSDKDFTARVGVDAAVGDRIRISGSISVLSGQGFHPGTLPTKDSFVWRDFNEDGIVQLSELQTIQGSAASPSSSFGRWGFGADIQLRIRLPILGELMAYAEAATASNLDRGVAPADPVFLGRDQRSAGFYVAVTQELGEHAMVGARYDFYDPNADPLDVQNGQTVLSRRTFKTLTLAAAGRLALPGGASGRVVAEAQLQENGLGRDESGRPTTLANNVLRARLEVAF